VYDAEKWKPGFRKDHGRSKILERQSIQAEISAMGKRADIALKAADLL
jgi:hypothetical protein